MVDEAAKTAGAAMLGAPTSERCGHVVIYDGKGGTVEAMDGKHGVTTSRLNFKRDYGATLGAAVKKWF